MTTYTINNSNMMVATKGKARFHESGYVSDPNNTGCTLGSFIPPHPDSDMTNPNNSTNGFKRLASCREELELSWRAGLTSQDYFHCISSCESEESMFECHKRRKTLEWEESSAMDADAVVGSNRVGNATARSDSITFVQKGMRICPSNRPPKQVTSTNHSHPPQSLGNGAKDGSAKAGWYDGEVDSLGNRHGKGITKHDDGTEYEGVYKDDVMEGWGRYKFVTNRHLVPDHSSAHSAFLHRQIERTFDGVFHNDKPNGMGAFVTKTVDSIPQGLGTGQAWASTQATTKFIEIVHDVGYHKEDGTARGEGIRFIFRKHQMDEPWEKEIFRLYNGRSTTTKVARGYGVWFCDCLGIDAPDSPNL